MRQGKRVVCINVGRGMALVQSASGTVGGAVAKHTLMSEAHNAKCMLIETSVSSIKYFPFSLLILGISCFTGWYCHKRASDQARMLLIQELSTDDSIRFCDFIERSS